MTESPRLSEELQSVLGALNANEPDDVLTSRFRSFFVDLLAREARSDLVADEALVAMAALNRLFGSQSQAGDCASERLLQAEVSRLRRLLAMSSASWELVSTLEKQIAELKSELDQAQGDLASYRAEVKSAASEVELSIEAFMRSWQWRLARLAVKMLNRVGLNLQPSALEHAHARVARWSRES
ncbi:hypothetical protein [Pseudomarimonas arenosa]|uniref:Uncharacterized protein n=1 Tax=Pseudomarimonas arenosa TaxID=2774145 RepID=A0AAW3ZFG4_9GAMM|nr:hypothetical protein [Pseudomarimonas arenosa]MBD8524898.1 hypothetical protein [Pseudomarimonas arenosa]